MTVMMMTVLPACFATPTSYSSSLISFSLTKRTTTTATLLQNLFIHDNKFLTNRHNGSVIHRRKASSLFEKHASRFESVSTSSSSSVSAVSDLRTNLEDVISNIQTSINTTYTSVESGIEQSIDGLKESLDSGVSTLFNYIDISKSQLGSKLMVSSDVFKNNLNKTGSIGVDLLRQTIVKAEDVFYQGAAFVVYSYESTKVLLPVEARNILNGSESNLSSVLKPIGSSIQQVFVVLEQIERSVGLNPNDPIVSFVIFLGASTTLGISYWVIRYGGYSGDLSPKSTLEILKNEQSVFLVDVRPEELREKEGIPDLRQGARFKYLSITFPKLDNSSKKLLKNTKDVEEATLAILIRNLKNIQDGSKVIIMDDRGEQSKGIARFLRKFGMKRSYLVKGGFRSWMKTGSKFKQLKTESALTILNEEAEAIFDDIKPTPALVISYGLVAAIAIYSLLEWEKTLQLIGIVGLGKTLYGRIALYENSDDFKQDLRLLLTPLDIGAQALAWTAEKLEPSKIALPTTPSSTEVQNRVMQAVAKHESQPSDQDDDKDAQSKPVDLKEA